MSSNDFYNLKIKPEPAEQDRESPKSVDYGEKWLAYEVKKEGEENPIDSTSHDTVIPGYLKKGLPRLDCMQEDHPVQHSSDPLPSTSGFNSQTQGNFEGISSQDINFNSESTSNSMDESCDNRDPDEGQPLNLHTETGPSQRDFSNQRLGNSSMLADCLEGQKSKKHRCDVCQKSFSRPYHLKRHFGIHIGIRPHQCQACDRRFMHLSHLKRHLRTHTGDKPHRCQVCGNRYSHSSTLKQHLVTHTGQRRHCCEICNRKFADPRNLSTHLRIHTNEKPFQCKVCGNKFTQSATLKRHSVIHTRMENPVEPFNQSSEPM